MFCIVFVYTFALQLTQNKMANKNVKTVKITIPNEIVLKRINSTPALNRLSRLILKVGENTEKVNHFQFAEQMRMFPVAGAKIKEVC